MSIYSGFLHGMVEPFKFKRDDAWWHFYLGDHLIAMLRKSGKHWEVVVTGKMTDDVPRLVKGFATRRAGIDYALQVHESTKETYNDKYKR